MWRMKCTLTVEDDLIFNRLIWLVLNRGTVSLSLLSATIGTGPDLLCRNTRLLPN